MPFVNRYDRREVNGRAPYRERPEAFSRWVTSRPELSSPLFATVPAEPLPERYGGTYFGNPVPAADAGHSHVVSAGSLAEFAHELDGRLRQMGARATGIRLKSGFVDEHQLSVRRSDFLAQSGLDLDFQRRQTPIELTFNGSSRPDSARNAAMFPPEARGRFRGTTARPVSSTPRAAR